MEGRKFTEMIQIQDMVQLDMLTVDFERTMTQSQVMQEGPTSYWAKTVYMDPIHGLIELHPLLVKIIDTPEFQRLRNIKQLGMSYYVYPGASHNRFEHSIGVCHLAGRFVRELKAKLDADGKVYDADGIGHQLVITPEDVLCVEIAGLCHDLGHGPFSHVFDGNLVKEIKAELEKDGAKFKNPECGKHEYRSVPILRHLITKNHLELLFEKYIEEDNIEDGYKFIEELITASERKETEEWNFEGREENKAFLYEIVSNMRHGIDVDKWDYFARDCHMLGIKNDFDHNRCIQFARVVMIDDRTHICYRDKEVHNLYEMFHTRLNLHVRAYQHKTTQILDYMVTEVLMEVRDDGDLKINGKTLKEIIREILDGDMTRFCLLTDDILSEILRKPDDTCTKAKEGIKAIYNRNVPHLIGQTSLKNGQALDLDSTKELKRKLLNVKGLTVKPDNVVIRRMDLNYGKKYLNPMDCVFFFEKNAPNKTFNIEKDKVSRLLPDLFSETKLRVYCRDEKQYEPLARRFTRWCEKEGFPSPTLCTPAKQIAQPPNKRAQPPNKGTPAKQIAQPPNKRAQPPNKGTPAEQIGTPAKQKKIKKNSGKQHGV